MFSAYLLFRANIVTSTYDRIALLLYFGEEGMWYTKGAKIVFSLGYFFNFRLKKNLFLSLRYFEIRSAGKQLAKLALSISFISLVSRDHCRCELSLKGWQNPNIFSPNLKIYWKHCVQSNLVCLILRDSPSRSVKFLTNRLSPKS